MSDPVEEMARKAAEALEEFDCLLVVSDEEIYSDVAPIIARHYRELVAGINAQSYACGLIYGYDKPFVGGCGKPVLAHESYRCADCTASFHRDCIREHFELDDAVKNLRARECMRKDCAEFKAAVAPLVEAARQVCERMQHNLPVVATTKWSVGVDSEAMQMLAKLSDILARDYPAPGPAPKGDDNGNAR